MDKRIVQNQSCIWEYFLHTWGMHIAQQIILRKKLVDNDEIPNFRYFEKNYDWIFHLYVYFSQMT